MTRIDFYVDAEDKLGVAIRIVQKAYAAGHQVVVLAPTELVELDRRLWTQQALAFLPHCRVGDALGDETPVLLAESSAQLHNIPRRDVLVNLSSRVPDGFAEFQRLIEIVGLDEDEKAPARERFRRYRSAGHEVQTHRLGETA